MSSLPSQHPSLSLHLTDNHLHPLITSSSSPSQLDSLTSLATSALTAQSTAARAKLGKPTRMIVDYPDHTTVLTSYLDVPKTDHQSEDDEESSLPNGSDTSSSAAAAAAAGAVLSQQRGREASRPGTAGEGDAPPRLVGLVVATAEKDGGKEALRAAKRLENVGREFQREWARENEVDGTSEES